MQLYASSKQSVRVWISALFLALSAIGTVLYIDQQQSAATLQVEALPALAGPNDSGGGG